MGRAQKHPKNAFDWGRVFRIGKEAFWVTLGQLLMILGALVGIRILTEILDPSQYGELALGNTVALFLTYVFFSPITSGAARFYPLAGERGELPSFFHTSRWLFSRSLGALAVVAVPFFLIVFFWAGGKWAFLCLVAVMYGIMMAGNNTLLGLYIVSRKHRESALLQGMEIWCRFFLAAALVFLVGATGTVALFGYLLSALVVLFVLALLFPRVLYKKKQPLFMVPSEQSYDWKKEMTSYSLPFAVWGVFTWLQFSSDKWVLCKLATTEEVGLYAALYQLGFYPIFIATKIFLQLSMPVLFGIAGDTTDKVRMVRLRGVSFEFLSLVIFMAVICFIVSYFINDFVFSVFVSEAYREVSYLLPWMLLAGGLYACGQAAYLSLLSQTRTKQLLLPLITTALLCVALNYLGAFYWGINGVVGAQVIFGIAYSLWLLRLLFKQFKNI